MSLSVTQMISLLGRAGLDYHPKDMLPWQASVLIEKPEPVPGQPNRPGGWIGMPRWQYTRGRTPEEALINAIMLVGASSHYHELPESYTLSGDVIIREQEGERHRWSSGKEKKRVTESPSESPSEKKSEEEPRETTT